MEGGSDVWDASNVTYTVAPHEDQCTIISDGFDILVQVSVGVTAVGLLVAKWGLFEKPRRPFWVWFADNSKQCGGIFVAHVGNIVMSQLLKSEASPCVWYVVNIFFDCTVRVGMAFVLLRWLQAWFRRRGWRDLIFGEYGELMREGSRRAVMCVWFKQSWVWVGIVAVTRIAMGLVFWAFEGPLSRTGTWLLQPLEDYTHHHGHDLELFVVMVLVPVVLISFQLWVQDTFLQAESRHRGEGLVQWCCPCVGGGSGGDADADSDSDDDAGYARPLRDEGSVGVVNGEHRGVVNGTFSEVSIASHKPLLDSDDEENQGRGGTVAV